MARPKKNVEIKEEKKKGRPKKVKVEKVTLGTLNDRVNKLENENTVLRKSLQDLCSMINDINMDIDEMCYDLYKSEETKEEPKEEKKNSSIDYEAIIKMFNDEMKKQEEEKKFGRLINQLGDTRKRTKIYVNGKKVDNFTESDLEDIINAMEELNCELDNMFRF